MNFFSRKPKPQIRYYSKPIGQMMWNPEIPPTPKSVVPEVLPADRPKVPVPVAAGYLDIDVQATPVPEVQMHPYQEPTFSRIFQDMLALGWDLPSHHATVLVRLLGQSGPRTLEQEFLVTRYLRDLGQQ